MVADARPSPPFAPGTRPAPASLARDRRRRALRAEKNAYVRALAAMAHGVSGPPSPSQPEPADDDEELFFDWTR